MRTSNERGIAMITTLLVLMLISALLVGFTAVVMSDQRYRFIDRDRGQAFYAASGALEKLTADLGNMFFQNVAPTASQVTGLTSTTPTIAGITYTATNAPTPLPGSLLSKLYCDPSVAPNGHPVTAGGNGYAITFCTAGTGNPIATSTQAVKQGPYEGLYALQTPYQLDVTAKTATGGEVHLIRTIEAVAIPVFQFGMFSDVDLSFFAGENFSFGGRVHTNGNLYLAESSLGSFTLTLADKVTAVKEVVRQVLSNGVTIASVGMAGTISLAKAPGCTYPANASCRNLAATEGSVVNDAASAYNEPTWHTISLSTYNSYIRNGRTGVKTLNLPLITVGGSNTDLVRRPATSDENVTNGNLFQERLFSKASIRILLSDNATDITNLPTVTSTTPVSLETNWNNTLPAGYGPIDATHPAPALSRGYATALVTSSSSGTITFGSSTIAAPFKPTFALCAAPPCATTTVITCTGKTTSSPYQLTGCTGSPAMPVTAAGATLAVISPGGGTYATGANAVTSAATTALSTTISFSTLALLNTFAPLPFWAGSTLVTCTGYTTTTYTGCSYNPAASTVLTSSAASDPGVSALGGDIKIEKQSPTGGWTDITAAMLSYGFGAPNLGGVACADPTPSAVIRLQRLRDNSGSGSGGCNYNTLATGIKDPTNWWPLSLFDTREAIQRDANPGTSVNCGTAGGSCMLPLGGVMYYLTIDAGNLAACFVGTAAPYNDGTCTGVKTDNGGYTVYFSDRRNNRNSSNLETGEYGWEDYVNPGAAGGAPNGTLDPGEDVNANTTLDVYGGKPNYQGTYNTVPPCTACPTPSSYPLRNTSSTPVTLVQAAQLQVNRPILFRRALKLTNGATLGSVITGLTIASENPVYVQGDWNANAAFTTPVAATALVADAVTVLSGSWNDDNSFSSPYNGAGRARSTNSWYRMAVLAGKGPSFTQPSDVAGSTVFGTDGGAHNFLRMLEGNNAGSVHYRGSLATFYYNRQAVGTFKCCSGTALDGVVYSVPVRDFQFDTNFQTPALLPPNTPIFRDMNAVGFSQELRPGK
jgi:Tfp pilus assembly protein PilX